MKSLHPPVTRPANKDVAAILRRIANLLEAQQANPFRVHDYRAAAEAVTKLDEDVVDRLARGGHGALVSLPDIGEPIAVAIEEFARTGDIPLLERLEGRSDPISLFATIPGVGTQLARKVHVMLSIDTLDELDAAARDGRLARVPGFGARRISQIREHLAAHFRRHRRAVDVAAEPSLAALLDVDAEYRSRVAEGSLPRITPRRFNPTNERWLPVLHTERNGWTITAMFSNTALAHERGRTADWVVLYFDRDGIGGQRTAMTEERGQLAGRRVIRGRETELVPALPRSATEHFAPRS